MTRNRLLIGDALASARALPSESVHCIVTSPPYWGLRSYLADDDPAKAAEMGAEPTLSEYVERMVALFRELRRVLRRDGVCWLNLGDCYAGTGKPGGGAQGARAEQCRATAANGKGTWEPPRSSGLKPKDLCLVPYRVAMALQADGWYLRSHIIWHKPNPMPESVTDRPTSAHEAVFLLTREPRYWYDADAIREASAHADRAKDTPGTRAGQPSSAVNGRRDSSGGVGYSEGGRNKRNVWTIATRPYSGSHYAVMPPALVEPCILAGCPAKACAECGAGWVRVVEKGESSWEARRAAGHKSDRGGNSKIQLSHGASHDFDNTAGGFGTPAKRATLGFRPSCDCDAGTVPGVTLDPFMGSGTVAMVAEQLGRDWIGFDLDARNAALVVERVKARTVEAALEKTEPGALPGQRGLFGATA